MKSYIDNFGIRFELPSIYVLDAIFYPANCIYSFQLVKYLFPKNKSQKVSSHYSDGIVEVSFFEQLYQEF